MSITRNSFTRQAAWFGALALFVGSVAPAFVSPKSTSAAQIQNRQIQMSDSGASGGSITSGVGSGTGVSYKITFTTAAAMQSVVVDFCDNTPLIGDSTCTSPAGFNSGSATLTANGSWSLTAATTQWKFSNTSSQAAGTFTFEVNSITNPSSQNHSFYARVTTYANDTYGTYSSYSSPGNYVDYGGIAISTTTPITVTARVMETLSLCTSAIALTNAGDCVSATTPSIILGHTSNNVLTADQVDTKDVYSQISTNAANGYALYLRASNTSCTSASPSTAVGGGLSKDGGTTCGIPAINNGSATPITLQDGQTTGNAAFGARVTNGVASTGGVGANTAITRWNPTAGQYLMDVSTSNDNVVSTYGSKIAETSGANPKQANGVNNTLTFAATAAAVTPAGIYSENFSLIGVGTF